MDIQEKTKEKERERHSDSFERLTLQDFEVDENVTSDQNDSLQISWKNYFLKIIKSDDVIITNVTESEVHVRVFVCVCV